MKSNISRAHRIIILVYAIFLVISGLFHMFMPQTAGPENKVIERMLGGAMLAFAFGAGLAYLEKAWDRIRIVILIQVAWMILYAITLIWGILTGVLPVASWFPAIIGAVVAILLTSLYLREVKSHS